MFSSAGKRVFISYSWKDGSDLAQRLKEDLRACGYDVWLDRQRLRGGASWTKEIEVALDEADFVLAVMTAGSYVSEICRAEQLRALRKEKLVIPLRAQPEKEVIPLHLETKNYRDFTIDYRYQISFEELLGDIRKETGITLEDKEERKRFRQTFVSAPPLPVNFVKRPKEFAALRDALITDGEGCHIALTALHGMGGIGKTVLAKAICHDEVTQQAFPDGVIWITVGQESAFDVVTRLREVGKTLNDNLYYYDNELGAKNRYRSTIRDKAALIVLDDVWKAGDLEPFLADSPRSRLLFTTRNANIAAAVGAREYMAGLLTLEHAREVLARWAGIEVARLPRVADDLIRECGRLPLALSMTGAMLRGRPSYRWERLLNLLRNSDLEMIRAQFPDYPYPSLLRAMQVSVDELDTTTRERYLALAVLPEDMPASPGIQRCLWRANEFEAADTVEQLVGLSLAQRDGGLGAIRIHDLQLDYVRSFYQDREALDLIHEAVRLSSRVLSRDPSQFASQMVGRLLAFDRPPGAKVLVRQLIESAPQPWIQPLWPALSAPLGTSLVRSMSHSPSPILGVAVSQDGRRAVSASDDGSVKVWDLRTCVELLTRKSHLGPVNSVTITPDGRWFVSASRDKTLKVWDLETGRKLRTLEGHSRPVRHVAVSPDGRLAVSASFDGTLRVWNLESGRELRILRGDSERVFGVALSRDGRYAVSASDDSTLKVWDLHTGRDLRTLKGHDKCVSAVAIDPTGRLAISAGSDSMLKLWDFETGHEIRTLRGHSGAVNSVAISPDGDLAASASSDNTVKAWSLKTNKVLATFTCDSAAMCCAWADCRKVIAGDVGGHIHLLQLEMSDRT